MEGAAKNEVIQKLKSDILFLQGFKPNDAGSMVDLGLGPIEKAFPTPNFLIGAVHELISDQPESAVATNAFIAAITGKLLRKAGFCVWVSTNRTVFPPTLQQFGIPPDRVLFADVRTPKEALWTIEEALKCNAVTAVIGEITELTFADSRRLQLAVENSRVTGFIHRNHPRAENTTACVTRWKVRPALSSEIPGIPGLGFPCWDIRLVKVRNGQPGRWLVEWQGYFRHVAAPMVAISNNQQRKTG